MALSFPSSPINGQVYDPGSGVTYVYNSTYQSWQVNESTLEVFAQTAAATLRLNALTGVVLPYAGNTSPSYGVLCHGQAISRTTYSTLYSVIGTTYGSGDGSTTFNVPDLRGRVAVGKDDMGGAAAGRVGTSVAGINGQSLGSGGGASEVTIAVTNLPAHSHTVNPASFVTSGSEGGHSHTWSGSAGGTTLGSGYAFYNSHTTDTYANGGQGAAKGMFSVGDHVHAFAASVSGTVNGAGTHQHTIDVPETTSSSVGSGTAIHNMQPSIILNYIIITGI